MRITFIIILICSTAKSYAAHPDDMINRIFNLAYNMNYQEAEVLLTKNTHNIDAFYLAVLKIDMSYWKNVTGTNKPNYEEFENTLEKFKFEQTASFEQRGIKLIRLSYQLRYELKRYRIFSAISTHKKTKLLFDELKQNPQLSNNIDNELFELYNAMFLYFSNYLKPFGGKSKEQNCQQAITQMKHLAGSEQIMTKTLASYFLGKTFLKYENTPEQGITYFSYLSKTYKGNTKFPQLLKDCRNAAN